MGTVEEREGQEEGREESGGQGRARRGRGGAGGGRRRGWSPPTVVASCAPQMPLLRQFTVT